MVWHETDDKMQNLNPLVFLVAAVLNAHFFHLNRRFCNNITLGTKMQYHQHYMTLRQIALSVYSCMAGGRQSSSRQQGPDAR